MDSKQDVLRDPIWQFIGVVVSIFLAFLTLPASVQGVALVGIAIACIFLIFIFAGKVAGLWRLAILFFILWTIWLLSYLDLQIAAYLSLLRILVQLPLELCMQKVILAWLYWL